MATVVGLTGVALLACLTALLFSISSPRSAGPGWLSLLNRPSPQELAREMSMCGARDQPGRDLRVHAFRDTPRGGRFVLFSVMCPPFEGQRGEQLSFGYSLREGSSGSGGMGPSPSIAPLRSAAYDVGGIQSETGRYNYVVGRITDERVATVEGTLEARKALGTTTKVETVNRALAEVAALAARRRDLRRLTAGELADLGDDDAYAAAWQ